MSRSRPIVPNRLIIVVVIKKPNILRKPTPLVKKKSKHRLPLGANNNKRAAVATTRFHVVVDRRVLVPARVARAPVNSCFSANGLHRSSVSQRNYPRKGVVV